jgi:hypothetical protein
LARSGIDDLAAAACWIVWIDEERLRTTNRSGEPQLYEDWSYYANDEGVAAVLKLRMPRHPDGLP